MTSLDLTSYKLPDEAFWASDERGSDPVARELVGEYHGIVIDCPARVDIVRRSTLPAGIYHLGTIRQLAAVRLDRFGVLTAVNLDTGQLHAISGRELEQDTDVVERPPLDINKLPEGDMSSAYGADLRSMLRLPWRPAHYLLTVLLRGLVSNRSRVELTGPPQERLADQALPPIYPPLYSIYQRHPKSPAVPAEPGITIVPARIVDLRKAWQWPVHGAFRLPLLDRETVRPGWSDEAVSVRAGSVKPAAVVSISLLINGANDGSLDVIPLQVPAYDHDGDHVTGFFNLDLMQLCDARTQQTYFISAFAGEVMTGPHPSAFLLTSF